MGTKGSRQQPESAAAAEALVADLAGRGDVSAKRMFGGVGIFRESVMFALVDPSGVAFLRGDEATASEFEAAGARRHGKMPHWELPREIRDDEAALEAWARRALDAARAAKAKK